MYGSDNEFCLITFYVDVPSAWTDSLQRLRSSCFQYACSHGPELGGYFDTSVTALVQTTKPKSHKRNNANEQGAMRVRMSQLSSKSWLLGYRVRPTTRTAPQCEAPSAAGLFMLTCISTLPGERLGSSTKIGIASNQTFSLRIQAATSPPQVCRNV